MTNGRPSIVPRTRCGTCSGSCRPDRTRHPGPVEGPQRSAAISPWCRLAQAPWYRRGTESVQDARMHISQGRGRGPEQPASAQGEKMGIGHRSARVGFVGLAATVLVAASMLAGAAATIAASAPGAGATHITLIGHGTLVPKGSTGTSSGTGLEVAPEPQVDAAIPHTGGGTIRF